MGTSIPIREYMINCSIIQINRQIGTKFIQFSKNQNVQPPNSIWKIDYIAQYPVSLYTLAGYNLEEHSWYVIIWSITFITFHGFQRAINRGGFKVGALGAWAPTASPQICIIVIQFWYNCKGVPRVFLEQMWKIGHKIYIIHFPPLVSHFFPNRAMYQLYQSFLLIPTPQFLFLLWPPFSLHNRRLFFLPPFVLVGEFIIFLLKKLEKE